ncbi:acyl-CoA carboxylase subunit epsilon [Streptomyces griseorubiginosus]|uniref:acyl-CoA carboxylase subunit epsilon n=1 Tax=Streptomyces griseorubiginosus TaxID=67304 RepID=UPI00367604B3
MSAPCEKLLRLEKGRAEPEELAAITVVLMARAATRTAAASARCARSQAAWCRLERTPGFDAPHSWQH